MKLEIFYKKVVSKFIKKNNFSKDKLDSLIIKAIKKIVKKEDINIDLKRLLTTDEELFRIRKGNIRIIFSFNLNGDVIVSFVENIGYRGDIYK